MCSREEIFKGRLMRTSIYYLLHSSFPLTYLPGSNRSERVVVYNISCLVSHTFILTTSIHAHTYGLFEP